MTNKVKITQKEFDDIYQIEDTIIPDKEITGDTPPEPLSKEDTTPFLTEEEEENEKQFLETIPMEEIE